MQLERVILLVGAIALLLAVLITTTKKDLFITVPSIGRILPTSPYLTIQLSPPGYPSPGQSWTISVFMLNVSSSPQAFQPAINSTVTVTLPDNRYKKTYTLPVDENGKTEFQFLLGYTDISFQAHCPGFKSSEKIILTENYVSYDVVDSLLSFNLIISISSSLGSGWLIRKRKVSKLVNLMFVFVTSLFLFVTICTLYSKLFQYTSWGYPERIMGDLITFTVLKYAFFAGVILLLSFGIAFCLVPTKVWNSLKKKLNLIFKK